MGGAGWGEGGWGAWCCLFVSGPAQRQGVRLLARGRPALHAHTVPLFLLPHLSNPAAGASPGSTLKFLATHLSAAGDAASGAAGAARGRVREASPRGLGANTGAPSALGREEEEHAGAVCVRERGGVREAKREREN